MTFRPATSLTDAYNIARREFPADFAMTLNEWLTDPYNRPIDPKWSGVFGMWTLDAVSIAPVQGSWSFANCFCGWKQINDAIAAA
ncbi:hypothetical protein [Pseudonocardia sp.]|uniref:hypothetical protein n=1 Tax=Pseudonocardia sp. TaxID=60912 RepID=UPI003D117E26